MKTTKRYQPGEAPKYDETYAKKFRYSPILTPKGNVDTHMMFFDKKNIQDYILERTGNGDGLYNRPGQRGVLASLPSIERDLEAVEQKFQDHNQQLTNQGRPVDEAMPPHILEKRHSLQAEQDIVSLEIATLEEMLSKFTDEDQERNDYLLLKYGPKGSSSLSGGYIAELDYQCVLPDAKGVMRIADSRSPYDEMTTVDYYVEVSKPWVAAKTRVNREQEKLAKELGIANIKSDVFLKAWSERYQELLVKYPEWKTLFGLSFKGKKIPLPPKENSGSGLTRSKTA